MGPISGATMYSSETINEFIKAVVVSSVNLIHKYIVEEV